MPAARNTNLDGLRGIAILMVLVHHSSYSKSFRAGWAGVDLFFVLSGFLVSGLLFDAFRQHGKIDCARFYIRRGLKIWPSFYVLIAVTVTTNWILDSEFSWRRILPELLFFQSYVLGLWPLTWSLAVEEHFYLILPAILLFALRCKTKRPFAAVQHVFVAVAVLCLGFRFMSGWDQNWNEDYYRYLFPTHLRLDGLMFGVLLCWYHRFRPDVFQRVASWRSGWFLVASAGILLFRAPLESRHMHTWGITVLWLASGCLVAKAVAFELPRLLHAFSRPMAFVGGYSYSIYLWHMFLQKRVFSYLHLQSPALSFICYLAGSIAFGIAAAKLIELPALRFRDRVFPRQAPGTRTALAATT
jgi:peptidoglycan/LPS O-acetylase OafA/YrhL